jgi:hypothetical protein
VRLQVCADPAWCLSQLDRRASRVSGLALPPLRQLVTAKTDSLNAGRGDRLAGVSTLEWFKLEMATFSQLTDHQRQPAECAAVDPCRNRSWAISDVSLDVEVVVGVLHNRIDAVLGLHVQDGTRWKLREFEAASAHDQVQSEIRAAWPTTARRPFAWVSFTRSVPISRPSTSVRVCQPRPSIW